MDARAPARPGSFLVVPAWGKGRGGGHLSRSSALVRSLRAAGAGAWLYREPGEILPEDPPADFFVPDGDHSPARWTLIILDRFRTGPEEMERWTALGPVLGIDEGLSRAGCDFLVDLLPGLPCGEAPNWGGPSLLPLPGRRRPSFFSGNSLNAAGRMAAAPGPFKVLISFGAEDPAGFTMEIPRLLGKGFIPAAVLGPLRRNNGRDRKILEEAGIPIPEGGAFSLRETLADYDLLITHFGVSAFEALYARLPVLLLNPGTFHAGLARRAGLASAGYGRGGLKNLARLFEKYGQDPPELLGNLARRSMEAARRWGLEQDSPGEGLAPLILQADPGVYRACPLCGKGRDPAASPGRTLARFPRRTYRRCFCGMVYMNRLDPPPVEYNMDYFFDGYRRQYGKTYLEDFPRLRQTAEGRIAHIRALLAADTFPSGKTSRIPAARPRLLDIGCAYGPFLAAARDAGFDVTGQDPVQEAVEYVSKNLGLRAFRGFFPGDFPKNTPPFEAITLWYVMEHLREPGKALGVINGLLKTGGVLAFSTPSLGGISRRKSLKKFLEQSPGDHWTLWTPRRCAAMLKPWGFSLRKMVITGNHPERFPLIGRYLEQPGRGYRFFAGVSAFCSLGDTFEAYAVKTGESPGGSHG